MAGSVSREKNPLKLSGSFSTDKFEVQKVLVHEGLSKLTEMSAELYSEEKKFELKDLLGQTLGVEVETQKGSTRKFSGVIVSAEEHALEGGMRQVVVETRPWLWMLTRVYDNRIFQEKTAVQIIEEVINENTAKSFKKTLSGSYSVREYCVQYRESNYDFICRLMEEEGLYFYFDHDDDVSEGSGKMVLVDGKSGHKSIPEYTDAQYIPDREGQKIQKEDFIWDFSAQQAVKSGKVELADFDFEKPKLNTTTRKLMGQSQKHKHKSYEVYDYPGNYRSDTGLGNTRAQVKIEAEHARHETMSGAGNLKTLAVGRLFKLKDHPKFKGDEFLVTEATHYVQTTSGFGFDDRNVKKHEVEFPEGVDEMFASEFKVIDSKVQYRAPLVTPWPEIPGLQTAIVTGKSGEEIWTDKYGRIKVQFHWDRLGKNDEKTTCWVRVATPWSGKKWGFISIPRIGQEVVIQFEEGDPDRPICTGMLYNADTMPPYTLPANQTQSGIKTNSSKGGAGFNELMFEDKKDSELVRFQSEKDYEQIVKNNATITIGTDKKDKGDLTQVVHNNQTETVKEGDHTFTVAKGNQIISIKTDQTETVEGKSTRTVTGNDATTIKTGNLTTDVNTGNMTTTVKTGNQTTTVKTGNITVDAKLGKISMSAMQSIELKVGGSSIKIDQMGVTIKGSLKVDIGSTLTTVKGDGMLTLKGGLTKIN